MIDNNVSISAVYLLWSWILIRQLIDLLVIDKIQGFSMIFVGVYKQVAALCHKPEGRGFDSR
jgi:hypothetical protein